MLGYLRFGWVASVFAALSLSTQPVNGNDGIEVCADENCVAAEDAACVAADIVEQDVAVQALLSRMHAYCTEEMDTEKYKKKPGGQLGSQFVRNSIKNPDLDYCSHANWRQSNLELGLSKETAWDPIFQFGEDPCKADIVFKFVGSGLGSWVSNLGNVLYQCQDQGQTCTFHLGNPMHSLLAERFEELFGHEIRGCDEETFDAKAKVMVSPGYMASMKRQFPCKYASVRQFFTEQLFRSMMTGAIGSAVEEQVAENLALLREQYTGSLPKDDDVPFIAVHVRNK